MNLNTKSENIKKIIFLLISLVMTVGLAVYYCYFHTKVNISSDSTTMLPLARDFLDGNLTLDGWVVGTNNFFFSETIFYCIGMLFGVSNETMILGITPVFLAIFMMYAACRMIFWENYKAAQVGVQAGKPDGVYADQHKRIWMTVTGACGSLCFVAAVGLFPYSMGYTYLNANSHNLLYLWIAIAVMCVCCYCGDVGKIGKYGKNIRFGKNGQSEIADKVEKTDKAGKKRYLIIYGILGVLMSFSENSTLMLLLGPVIMFSAVQFLLEKKRRGFYAGLASVSVGAYAAAKIWLALLEHFGGLVVRGLPMSLVLHPAAVWNRFIEYSRVFYTIFDFYGLHTIGLTSWVGIYNLMVFLGMLIFVLGIVMSVIGYLKLPALDRLLVWMVVLNIAGCIFTDVAVVARYMVPMVCFGMILGCRMMIRSFYMLQENIAIRRQNRKQKEKCDDTETGKPEYRAEINSENRTGNKSENKPENKPKSKSVWMWIPAVFSVLLCGVMLYGGIFRCVNYKDMPVYGDSERQVVSTIEQEGLGDGYGAFWSASINSYYSDFKYHIYPVYIKNNRLTNYYELVNKSWYDEKDKHYVVTYDHDNIYFSVSELTKILGEADRVYECGTYMIYYWDRDISESLQIAWP